MRQIFCLCLKKRLLLQEQEEAQYRKKELEEAPTLGLASKLFLIAETNCQPQNLHQKLNEGASSAC